MTSMQWNVLFLTLVSCTTLSTALSVNHTIDDASDDSDTHITYLPAEKWNQGSTCSRCFIDTKIVDTSQVFNGTWHDSTFTPDGSLNLPQVQVSFTGTAVYVYNLIANTIPFTTTLTNLTFLLDGQFIATYIHAPDSSPQAPEILYHQLVYSNTSLSDSEHHLVMEAGGANSSLILFDYIIYTAEETASPSLSPSSTSSIFTSSPSTSTVTASSNVRSRFPVGAIVGGVVGGLFAIAGTLLLFVFLRRRSRSRKTRPQSVLTQGKPEFADGADMNVYQNYLPSHPSPITVPSMGGSEFHPLIESSTHISDGVHLGSELFRPPASTQSTLGYGNAESAGRAHALTLVNGVPESEREKLSPTTGHTTDAAGASFTVRALEEEVAILRSRLAGLGPLLVDVGEPSEPPPQYDG